MNPNTDIRAIKAVLNTPSMNLCQHVGQRLRLAWTLVFTPRCSLQRSVMGGEILPCACLYVWLCFAHVHVPESVCTQVSLLTVTFPSPSLSVGKILMWIQHQTDNGERERDRQGERARQKRSVWGLSVKRTDGQTDSASEALRAVIGWLPPGRRCGILWSFWSKLQLILWMSPTEYIT